MIRALAVTELELLIPLAREFYASSRHLVDFEAGLFVDLWTRLLTSQDGVIFVIEEGTEIVGCIGGMAHREPYSRRLIAQEFYWYVRSSNRGGGARLYFSFEQWARNRGCQEIRMGFLTDSMPEKVAHFYARAGLQPMEVVYGKTL